MNALLIPERSTCNRGMIVAAQSAFAQHSASPATLGLTLAELGRRHAVVRDERMGAPLLLRYRDVWAALRDTSTFSTRLYGVGPMRTAMIARDGADHLRQRRIHNRFFSASASSKYSRIVGPIAEETFGALAARDRAELVSVAIAHYPMRVFLALLGIPDELGEQGLRWVRTIVSWLGTPLDPDLAGTEPGETAFAELSAYVRGLVERESAAPGDNLLGEIIRAHVGEGEHSAEAVTVAVVSLILGGFETTIQLLSGTLAALLLNPQALRRVREDPLLVDAAMDEAFRWANPSAGLYRLVARDVTVGGTLLPAGSMVYLCIAAAHFDEDVYALPGQFDLGRRGMGHLGFGAGPHYCSGAPLAKIEVRAAVNALLRACPNLRLDNAAPPSFYYGAREFVQHGTDALTVLI